MKFLKLFIIIMVLQLIQVSVGIILAQHKISFNLDPRMNRGYIFWDQIEGAKYLLNIYDVDYSLINPIVHEELGSKNFVKLDLNLINKENIIFQIIALDEIQGNVVGISPFEVSKLPPGGNNLDVFLPGKVCNGRHYAWELGVWAKYNPGGYLSNYRLQLLPTAFYYNQSTGNHVPFWEAIDFYHFVNGLPQAHPYRHDHTLVPFDNSADELVYRDRNNNVVTKGFLVDKKVNDFTYLSGTLTNASVILSEDIFGAPLVGEGNTWINIFNQHREDFAESFSYNNYGTDIPDKLACRAAFVSDLPGHDLDNWNEWLTNLYSDIEKLEETSISRSNGDTDSISWEGLSSYLQSFSTIKQGSDHDFIEIQVRSISTDSISGFFTVGENLNVREVSGKLLPGLYKIFLFSRSGLVIPFITEFQFPVRDTELNQLNEVSIFPNPLEGDQLSIEIKSVSSSISQIKIFNSSGIEVSHIEFELFQDHLNNYLIPIKELGLADRILVSVVFQDGSSITNQVFID